MLSLALDEPATDWTADDLSPANRQQIQSMIDMPPEEMFPVLMLSKMFSDFNSEEYAGLHHFIPSMAVQPARLATALRSTWKNANASPQRAANSTHR